MRIETVGLGTLSLRPGRADCTAGFSRGYVTGVGQSAVIPAGGVHGFPAVLTGFIGRTAPVVAQLVARLDGMPLAIELAAARVEALGVTGLLDRLDDRFALLSAGDRTAPSRQRAAAGPGPGGSGSSQSTWHSNPVISRYGQYLGPEVGGPSGGRAGASAA
jgi:hypothetical protein